MSIGPSTSGKRWFCQDREDALRLFPWQKRDESPAGQPGPLAESQCAVFITYNLNLRKFKGLHRLEHGGVAARAPLQDFGRRCRGLEARLRDARRPLLVS